MEPQSFLPESSEFLDDVLRELNATRADRGRTVLTGVYLCVLGLCFMTPVLYYCRLQFDERYSQRLRELEAAGLSAALERSINREESRAVRRKYIEERRARILQLFLPVRTILTDDSFTETQPGDDPRNQTISKAEGTHEATIDSADPGGDMDDANKDAKNPLNDEDLEANPYGDEDSAVIRVPVAGLHLGERTPEMRLVPGICTICLCPYTVGCDVVWSSNSLCEHVFHEECIEKWLMKQREGPLCPCCRRDFIVDPYDMEEEGLMGMFSPRQETEARSDGDTVPTA